MIIAVGYRVDSEKEHIGLTNWKNSPDGPIYKYDIDIAKNYLNEKELKDLNRIVTLNKINYINQILINF